MKAPKSEELFAQLALLNQPQRQQLLAALHPAAGVDRVIALIGDIRLKGRRCPDRLSGNGARLPHSPLRGQACRRFKEWLARFHEVASRRLPNYLGWHWALDGGRVTSVEQLLRVAFGFINR